MAQLTAGLQRARKELADHVVRVVPGDTQQDRNAVLVEDAGGTRAHAASQDHGRALLPQPHRKDTAAVLRRRDHLSRADLPLDLVYRVQSESLGATEVGAEPVLTQGNCYLHRLFSFLCQRGPGSRPRSR